MFTQACHINLSVKLAIENLNSVKLTMKLSGCSFCSCCENLDRVWICRESLKFEYEVLAKGCIKHEVVAKAWIKHKYMSRNLFVINVAFGFCSDFIPKKFSARTKIASPPSPPPHLEYQMDRAYDIDSRSYIQQEGLMELRWAIYTQQKF